MIKDILKSKTFWIIVVAILLARVFYQMGRHDNHVMTHAEEEKAIRECERWNGVAVYDRSGKYTECAINGELGN